MPRPDPDQGLLPSVLDRLIDHEPRVSTEPPASRYAQLARLKEAVKRDLEWLLNSRQIVVEIPPALRHLHGSLLTFGLPDFTHASLVKTDDREALRRALEQAISRFEPRLTNVAVTLVECREFDRSLRFRIDAALRIEPAAEPITFDSVLKLPTKAFEIQSD
ncbi:MAG: type VI secretion system baseplate subunit TssE [Isosphaeraceae bacterium]|nr:type VI secretion system baseplate subunit TssE [Isosphaeraceae bacterium]